MRPTVPQSQWDERSSGAWRYSFTSTLHRLNGKERPTAAWEHARASSPAPRRCVSVFVCVEMQNGYDTPQGEVYREAFVFFSPYTGSLLIEGSFNFLGRTLSSALLFILVFLDTCLVLHTTVEGTGYGMNGKVEEKSGGVRVRFLVASFSRGGLVETGSLLYRLGLSYLKCTFFMRIIGERLRRGSGLIHVENGF